MIATMYISAAGATRYDETTANKIKSVAILYRHLILFMRTCDGILDALIVLNPSHSHPMRKIVWEGAQTR